MAKYYAALGKPWNNPRLGLAEQYALRYRLDPIFRQKEIHRQGKRKDVIAARDDGTIDFSLLYTERQRCPYCGIRLVFTNRVLDHMDPISRGGEHSASNITVCCTPCNKAKGMKTFDGWLRYLPSYYQHIARALYERKHNTLIEQGKLFSGPYFSKPKTDASAAKSHSLP